MGTACKWAYPGQATGKISGSAYSIVCLGPNGQVLGGFSNSHSLNAWCADSRHTNGKHASNPALSQGSVGMYRLTVGTQLPPEYRKEWRHDFRWETPVVEVSAF